VQRLSSASKDRRLITCRGLLYISGQLYFLYMKPKLTFLELPASIVNVSTGAILSTSAPSPI
jgi:hypothetical protein